ncbi:DEAD/DEAH box helicase [Baekduia soli]|uniref:DEAD/DEAH box helicase n=1 Tax=Baekduia soli TaxID=496014 RepID=A0A5B8U2W7_9ACTN|nr:DEAD/DEAH box helicase [Baekduia soli]
MSRLSTPTAAIPLLAAGARVEVRDEDWLITRVQQTKADGLLVRATGLSELVRDQEATFFTNLDDIKPLRPEDTTLVHDDSPGFRRGRLYLEALLRRTPLPVTEIRPAIGHRQLLDPLDYQERAVALALEQPRPRLLIADAVGLGKTLEVGMILSELIRRGRGERILVVTPRHILEQFQHELWTRFCLPLVRLDSQGVERVWQKIPRTRNPFSFYKRVIVSIDTLKNPGQYGPHLERIHWDAVVIDECHNVANRSAFRNRLARLLAPRTDALLLTSATPHNGKRESFAELIRMLDPTAIADPKSYKREDIEHLYIRRFKKDVAAEVGHQFPDRLPPKPIAVPASPRENAVIAELAGAWLYPGAGGSPVSGKGSRLFPWTLLKAFLSSHVALRDTILERRKKLSPAVGQTEEQEREDGALAELAALNDQIDDDSSAKLRRLIDELKTLGVGPRSTERVVVFSERIATLHWLAETVSKALKLPDKAVAVMHGGLPDTEQMRIVEEFGQDSRPLRLLFTGDVASEGVNLHKSCHHLIHFDLPWSVIRIDQRNGRIDRYGQRHAPEIRALLLQPDHDKVRGDLAVLKRLLEKEHEIHQTLGEAAALMGLHAVDLEEDAIAKALAAGESAESAVPEEPDLDSFDLLALMAGGTDSGPVEVAEPITLVEDHATFVHEALEEESKKPHTELNIAIEPENSFLAFDPPRDLQRRLSVLPQSYLNERKITQRLKLTTDKDVATAQLVAAQRAEGTMWPETGYLGEQHPVVEWLVDKVLANFGRGEAPVFIGDVASPVVLLLAMCSNQRGQATVVEWLAAERTASGDVHVEPLPAVLKAAGIGPSMVNTGAELDITAAQALIPKAVDKAKAYVIERRAEQESRLEQELARMRARAQSWEQLTLELATKTTEREKAAQVRTDAELLADRMSSHGQPLLRVVGAILPAA